MTRLALVHMSFTHTPYHWSEIMDLEDAGVLLSPSPASSPTPSSRLVRVVPYDDDQWTDRYDIPPDDDDHYHEGSPWEEELVYGIHALFGAHRGSLRTDHVEQAVRRTHADLYSRVVWDEYDGDWHRFLAAHPDRLCLECDDGGGSPHHHYHWRLRLPEHPDWRQEDRLAELAQRDTQRHVCLLADQMLKRSRLRLRDLRVACNAHLLDPRVDLVATLLGSHRFLLDGDVIHPRRRVVHNGNVY